MLLANLFCHCSALPVSQIRREFKRMHKLLHSRWNKMAKVLEVPSQDNISQEFVQIFIQEQVLILDQFQMPIRR